MIRINGCLWFDDASYARHFGKRVELFPFGFLHIYRATHTCLTGRLLLIGVADSLRNKGVTSLIFNRLINTFMKYGIQRIESNPELETNHTGTGALQKI